MSVVKSSNSSINSNQHHCVSHWRKCVPQALPVRKETKVLEGDEECKALRVKKEWKAKWVYLENTVSKALWKIKEQKEKRVKKVNRCTRQSWSRKICLRLVEFLVMIIGIVYSPIYSSVMPSFCHPLVFCSWLWPLSVHLLIPFSLAISAAVWLDGWLVPFLLGYGGWARSTYASKYYAPLL